MSYSTKGCMNIMNAVFKKCLTPTKDKDKAKVRINYADNSPLFKLWCLLEGLDYNQFRSFILLKNRV